MNLTKFNKAKCVVLLLVWGNPNQKYRLCCEWTDNSPEEKELAVLLDEKLNRSWQCVLVAQKAKPISCAASKQAWPVG